MQAGCLEAGSVLSLSGWISFMQRKTAENTYQDTTDLFGMPWNWLRNWQEFFQREGTRHLGTDLLSTFVGP